MKEFRIGQGYDVHQMREGLPMWLCGQKIDSAYGFVAHSDGDVPVHALCDALLGALALGDIGHFFPDSDPRYKGISSIALLRDVADKIRPWTVENVDITLALQAPKIAPYLGEMRRCLADALGVEPDRVSIKATTTEHLGFVGRLEGCQAWAVAMLSRERGE